MTLEVACFPPDSELDDFGWRVSVAHIAEASPFSYFPGVERTLICLSGNLGFERPEDAMHGCLRPGDVLRFGGETRVVGQPIGGGCIDLNVMVRRGSWQAEVHALGASSRKQVRLGRECTVLFFTGEGRVEGQGDALSLDPHDALKLDGPGFVWIESRSPVHVIRLRQFQA